MKLRISYSLLSAWERGRPDEVVNTYFHINNVKTPQLEYGEKFHEDMKDHITKMNSFPDWFFDFKLTVPEPEKKIIVPYNELFDISAQLDLIDMGTIYEYKTGVQSSGDWSRKNQLDIYFLACELAKIKVDKAFLLHWNQYDKSKDYTLIWNSPKKVENARNWIDSVAPEIHSFFHAQGLI